MEQRAAVKNRIIWADIAKALSIVAIVFGHTVKGGAFKIFLYTFHVPCFFFISGFVFKTCHQGFSSFLRKKVKNILIPYYIFSVISILLYQLIGDTAAEILQAAPGHSGILPNLLGMLYGNSKKGYMRWNLPLWFLPCLFAVYILFYGVARLLEKNSGRPWLLLVPPLFFAAAGALNTKYLHIYNMPFAVETAVNMLVFFSAGYACRQLAQTGRACALLCVLQKKRVLLYVPAAVFAALCVAVSEQNGLVDYGMDSYHHLGLFYVGAAAGILFIISLSAAIGSCLKFLTYMGQRTLPILIMHKFPILFFQMVVPFTRVMLAEDRFSAALLVTAATIMLCLIADRVLRKIAPFAVGASG